MMKFQSIGLQCSVCQHVKNEMLRDYLAPAYHKSGLVLCRDCALELRNALIEYFGYQTAMAWIAEQR